MISRKRALRLAAAIAFGSAWGASSARAKGQEKTEAALKQSCEKEQTVACVELGDRYRDGRAADKDEDSSARRYLYERACRLGDQVGCARVRELPENPGIADMRKDCDRDDAQACRELSLSYDTGTGTAADRGKAAQFLAKAAALYSRACDKGEAARCEELGGLYKAGPGVLEALPEERKGAEKEKEYALKAAEAFKKGCDLMHVDCCKQLASMQESVNFPGDLRVALQAQLKVCDLKDAAGCFRAAELYEGKQSWGGPRPVKRDLLESAELYRKACGMGSKEACAALEDASKGPVIARKACEKECSERMGSACVDLGDMHKDGPGVEKNEANALSFYLKACDAGFGKGCARAGALPSQEKRAAELYRKACDQGSAEGCRNLCFMHARGSGAPKDLAKAAEYYSKAEKLYIAACGRNSGASCLRLGELYQMGPDMKSQPEKAVAAFQKACSLAQAEACNQLGGMYADGMEIGGDAQKALQLYGKSCHILQDEEGCFLLAQMYSGGSLEVPMDRVKSAELARKACGWDSASGCALLAGDYRRGWGVAQDEKRAVELYDQSCAMGSQIGCAALKNKRGK